MKSVSNTVSAKVSNRLLRLAVLGSMLFGFGCATTPPPAYPPPYSEGQDVTACFHDFTDVYAKRIYPVLQGAPGVRDLWRLRRSCHGSENCICYGLLYSGTLQSLEGWIYRELPTSRAVPFQIDSVYDNFMEIRYNGGFD